EAYQSYLRDKLHTKIVTTLAERSSLGQHAQLIKEFEALPKNFANVAESPEIAWFVAEAYRKLKKREDAVRFYQTAAGTGSQGTDQFKALFWQSVLANEITQTPLSGGINATERRRYTTL